MKIISRITAALFLLSFASIAQAETVCEPRTHVTAALEVEFKERVNGRGLTADNGHMLELYVSKSGSWTILATSPQGQSCLIAEGQNWHDIKPTIGEGI